jgi:hypothetical protein
LAVSSWTLRDTFSPDNTIWFQSWKAVNSDAWKGECVTRGLLDPAKPDSMRTLFNKHKRDLIAAGYVTCNGEKVWLVE